MPIVIDICCLSRVFNKGNIEHANYEPVFHWIIKGKGAVFYGGSGYKNELRKMPRFLNFILQLKAIGKARNFDDVVVDAKQDELRSIIRDSDFDDPHIMALLIISEVGLFCTSDARSFKYITRGEFYRGHVPAIYTSLSNAEILADKYVPDKYKPLKKINKKHVLCVNAAADGLS
jgi:hypothetical protein